MSDRIAAVDVSKAIRRQYREWQPNQIVIEDAASGTQAIQALRRALFPIVAFNPRKMPKGKNAKEERANLAALMIAQTPIYYDEKDASVQAALQQWLEFPRGDFDDLVDCLVVAILFLKARNEFDSSFETWSDEITLLRDEIEYDEDDEREAERMAKHLAKPMHARPTLNPYSMSPAQRHKFFRDQKQRAAGKPVDPFEHEDFAIEFTDD